MKMVHRSQEGVAGHKNKYTTCHSATLADNFLFCDAYMGSGPFMTGASGFSGSYTMPVPIGFQVKSKLGIELQVSCVQISLVSMLEKVKGQNSREKKRMRKRKTNSRGLKKMGNTPVYILSLAFALFIHNKQT